MPGHSEGLTGRADETVGLNDYVKAIDAIAPAAPPSVLIGHSMGGMAISAFAAANPTKVERLIYVAAMLPADGDTAIGLLGRYGADLRGVITDIAESGSVGALSPQPLRPFGDAFDETPAFGAIPLTYVKCDGDRVLPLKLQEEMIDARGPSVDAHSLKSGHLPQLTALEELVAAISAALAA